MRSELSINNAKVLNSKNNRGIEPKRGRKSEFIKSIKKSWPLYVLLILPIIYLIIFEYAPMVGVLLAFKKFSPINGFLSGKWIGFKNFDTFFHSYNFWRIIRNTVIINLYQLVAAFPMPILLAISINEVKNKAFKKTVQLVTYAPHFISTVILVSMLLQVLSIHGGVINTILKMLGHETINFVGEPKYFRHLYVWSGIWQNMGYSSIIYIAALTGIDPELYEAAIVDGANKIKKIIYIDLPGIMPTAIILLILNIGHMMSLGFEKTFLLQNDMNIINSEVISTYVYKAGLVQGDYSFATAVGLFNSLINLMLIIIVNRVARKLSDTSLW